jgi:hypothetical protein
MARRPVEASISGTLAGGFVFTTVSLPVPGDTKLGGPNRDSARPPRDPIAISVSDDITKTVKLAIVVAIIFDTDTSDSPFSVYEILSSQWQMDCRHAPE